MATIEIDNLKFIPFISNEEINERISVLGEEISEQYKDKNPVFIGVFNGCFMFMADLMKKITVPCEMSFVKLASYEGTEQGEISQLIGVGMDLKNRHIVVVEDVVDSGNSLVHTLEALNGLGVASVSVCTLLIKPSCLQHEFNNINYVGFEIAPEFVIGYGLDYNGLFRNLPEIYKEASLS